MMVVTLQVDSISQSEIKIGQKKNELKSREKIFVKKNKKKTAKNRLFKVKITLPG
jgi:hypothetical protein